MKSPLAGIDHGKPVGLTELEEDVLRGIYASEYADGSDQPAIWSWSIRAKVATAAQVSGVVSSLAKKGAVTCYGDGKERTIRVTLLGASYARAMGLFQ